MKNYFLSMTIMLVITSCTSVKVYNEQITSLHAVEDLQSDVDKVYKQLKKHHPKLYQYTPKPVLDFKFDSLKSSITKPMNSRQFYKKLAPVLAHVKQGHISISSANKRFTRKERKQLKKKKFEFYELDFEYLNDKLWITNTRGKDSSIVGSEVIRIEDDLATDLVALYKKRFASDGFNKTLHNRYVSKGFTSFFYKDKGFADSLKVTLRHNDSIFTRTFRRVSKKEKEEEVLNDSVKVAIKKKKKPKKLTREEKLARRIENKRQRKYNRKHGYIASRKQYTRNFKFIGQDSTVGLMKIRAFGNGNYKKFYAESFAKLDSAKTKNFILDLRDNGGGRIAEIDYLYGFLTEKNYQFITESEVNSRIPFLKYLMSNTSSNSLKAISGILSPFIVAHNLLKIRKKDGKLYYNFKKHTKVKSPHPLNYNGKLYVLINGNSFSASSLISTHLKANKRAVFVGEETGGAYNGTVAGIYKIYQLPTSKLKIRMGLMQIEAPQKQVPDGYGIKPDIEKHPTIEDRISGKDTELEWLLNDIYGEES